MPSSYKSLNLFGSGPHRFHVGPQGLQLVLNVDLGTAAGGTVNLGLLEWDVFIRGRLIAANDAALWVLRDAITAQITNPPVPGTLIDHHGRTWTNRSLVKFTSADRTDRGRLVSIGYVAQFRELPVDS